MPAVVKTEISPQTKSKTSTTRSRHTTDHGLVWVATLVPRPALPELRGGEPTPGRAAFFTARLLSTQKFLDGHADPGRAGHVVDARADETVDGQHRADHVVAHELTQEREADYKKPIRKRNMFGKDNLYFCGYYVSPSGMLREIKIESGIIAEAIQKRQ